MAVARKTFTSHENGPFIRRYLTSRLGDPWPALTTREQEALIARIIRNEQFSGLQLRAFAVAGKSFHLLIDEPTQLKLSDDEMMIRLKALNPYRYEVDKAKLESEDVDTWEKLRSRFGNPTQFIKNIKQETSHHYHQSRQTSGALWAKRYTNTFVEAGHPSRFLAAWIAFLNFRTGENKEPEESTLNYYGKAVAGDSRARQLVHSLYLGSEIEASWEQSEQAFRDFVSGEPYYPIKKKKSKGKPPLLTRAECFRTNIEALSSGLALGTRGYVEDFFEHNRKHFGKKRKSGARRISGQNDPDLWTARKFEDLRLLS